MNEEYENILKQLDDLPRKLNIEIRAIMLSNICLQEQNKKYKEVIDTLEFIKARAKEGATQETINKLAITFVNKYLKRVE